MRSFLIFKVLTASNSTLKLALFHLTYRKNRTVKIIHQKLLRGLNECTWIAFFFNTKITFKIKITGKSMMKLETAENCFFIISHLIRNSNIVKTGWANLRVLYLSHPYFLQIIATCTLHPHYHTHKHKWYTEKFQQRKVRSLHRNRSGPAGTCSTWSWGLGHSLAEHGLTVSCMQVAYEELQTSL